MYNYSIVTSTTQCIKGFFFYPQFFSFSFFWINKSAIKLWRTRRSTTVTELQNSLNTNWSTLPKGNNNQHQNKQIQHNYKIIICLKLNWEYPIQKTKSLVQIRIFKTTLRRYFSLHIQWNDLRCILFWANLPSKNSVIPLYPNVIHMIIEPHPPKKKQLNKAYFANRYNNIGWFCIFSPLSWK
jgi:hypothetical protein